MVTKTEKKLSFSKDEKAEIWQQLCYAHGMPKANGTVLPETERVSYLRNLETTHAAKISEIRAAVGFDKAQEKAAKLKEDLASCFDNPHKGKEDE